MLDSVDIGLAIEMDAELERLGNGIHRMDASLKKFFKEKHCDDVSHVFIGLILTSPAGDRLHPMRRARFKRAVNFTSLITQQRVNLQNVLEFDVKPDYEDIRVLNADAAIEYIARDIVASIEQLNKLAKQLPTFDIAEFRRDVASCLLP